MKTVQQVQTEIDAVENKLRQLQSIQKPLHHDRLQAKRLTAELRLLRERKMYLESAPSKEYLADQREKLKKILQSIQDKAASRTPPRKINPKNHRAAYNTEMGVPLLKARLETVEYLLGDVG